MQNNKNTIWDVVVVGGGASGMMAAGRSAELGKKVLLLEKNEILGKKLLITGGGRCNLTNAEFDLRKFLERFKESGKFLFSSFSQWSSKDSLNFFNKKGMPTKIEEENRAFPKSDSAKSVWDVLVKYLKDGDVTVLSNSPVKKIIKEKNIIKSVELKNGKIIEGKSFILATGGKSKPETGSTGDGFLWLKNLGHKVIEPNPALVPISIKESWVKKLQGLSLSEAKITVTQNEKKHISKKGKILFTHFGLSGPTILNMAKDIGELLKQDKTSIYLDILPLLNQKEIDDNLQKIFEKNKNKKFKNSLKDLKLPSAIIQTLIEISKIDPEKFCNSITKKERSNIVKSIKEMEMTVSGLLGAKKAIVTSGGVDLTEINFKTMQSKLFPNLYIIGDLLNIDKPSGGYSLQLCWTTGHIAGSQ